MTEEAFKKLIDKRIDWLCEDPVYKAINDQFGRLIFRRSSLLNDLHGFIKQNKIKGKCCFEIGTFRGLTAILFSRYFDEVHTIEIYPDPKTREIIEFTGIKNIHLYEGDNKLKEELANKLDFDFCYMDGNHHRETTMDWELVKKCGKVLFHEYWPKQPPVYGLVNSLPEREVVKNEADCFALWTRA